jgi:hypothetical protein
MIFDNEEQRKLLLQIIESTNVHGLYQAAKEAVLLLDNLLKAVNEAEVKK